MFVKFCFRKSREELQIVCLRLFGFVFFAKFEGMELLVYWKYIFWVPIICWLGLFFWFKCVSYPLYLKQQMKLRKKWAYVPEPFASNSSLFKRLRFGNIVLVLLTVLTSSVTVVWLLDMFMTPAILGFVSAVPFIWLVLIMKKSQNSKLAYMFQSAYYLEYCRVRYRTDKSGISRNEEDLHNRTTWSFGRKLRNAENHGRFWKYLKAMASSKKLPPDIYAETVYER